MSHYIPPTHEHDLDPVDGRMALVTGQPTFHEVTEAVAKPMVRGRLPRHDEPTAALAQAASRLSRNDRRPALDGTLASQAAALVLQRVAPSRSPLPPFDPSPFPPRERWELALDVLDPVRRLTAGLGKRLD